MVVISDEDDCSAADTALFDPEDPNLGALSSFRCFEQGVVCDPDDPRAEGDKAGCRPRDDASTVAHVQAYVDFLRGLDSCTLAP